MQDQGPAAGAKDHRWRECLHSTQECVLFHVECIEKGAWHSDRLMCNASFKAQFQALSLVDGDSH